MKAIYEFEAPESCGVCKVATYESHTERWCPLIRKYFRLDDSELAGKRDPDCPIKFIKGSMKSSNVPMVDILTDSPLHWETVYDDWGNYYACPRCKGTTHGIDYKFCPRCGVRLFPPTGGG